MFRCVVSLGSCSDTSNAAVLVVNNNLGINYISKYNLFAVYPNPAKSVIYVKAEAKVVGSNYIVQDNSGKSILTGKLSSQNTTIELDNLSPGIYLLSIGEDFRQTFKVIKE